MNKKVVIGIVLAVAAVAAALAGLIFATPQSQPQPPSPQPQDGKVYTYLMRLESTQSMQSFARFITAPQGAVYIQSHEEGETYIMFRKDGVVNIMAKTPESLQRISYYSRLMEICVNTTTTTTIAGEKVTVSNSQCTPSGSPLPTAQTFDEVVLLIQGLPTPRWTKAGTAQTPLGLATLYANTTEIPIMVGLNAVLNYEKAVLNDGTVYSLKISVSYGGRVAAVLTYTLQNVTSMTPQIRETVQQLAQNIAVTAAGGLDILKVAEKIGMTFGGGWPAAVVFYDLYCPYCAMLFRYNSTLFEGHRLVLVDLLVHQEAAADHEKLRCLYNRDPTQVMSTLRMLYDRFLAGDRNFTDILPEERCRVDFDSAFRLASLIAGQNVGTPMTVVVYPNGTYRVVNGYDPKSIAAALGK